MVPNGIQSQQSLSLRKFQSLYAIEAECHDALEKAP
jgi:hypothetical protein